MHCSGRCAINYTNIVWSFLTFWYANVLSRQKSGFRVHRRPHSSWFCTGSSHTPFNGRALVSFEISEDPLRTIAKKQVSDNFESLFQPSKQNVDTKYSKSHLKKTCRARILFYSLLRSADRHGTPLTVARETCSTVHLEHPKTGHLVKLLLRKWFTM